MNNSNPENLEKIFDFLKQVGKLKTTFRFGEIGKKHEELKDSSAAHSWRLALMVFIMADELNIEVNIEKALKLAIVHDIVESVVGDVDQVLVFDGKMSKEEKQKNEKGAIEQIKARLSIKLGNEISNLWNEYEKGSTGEAKFVKALDKLETLTHLIEAGYKTYDRPEMIANYADKAVKEFPELKGVLKIIKQKIKAEFDKGDIPWREEYNVLD